MTNKSPFMVLLLSCVTCGIYQLVWTIKAREEMVARGADIPGNIWIFLPVMGIIYMWKWCKGVEHVTKGATSGITALLLLMFLGPIGAMIIQGKFNEVR